MESSSTTAAFLLVLLSGLCAPLGACVVFLLHRVRHQRMLSASLGLAAGVMTLVSLSEVSKPLTALPEDRTGRVQCHECLLHPSIRPPAAVSGDQECHCWALLHRCWVTVQRICAALASGRRRCRPSGSG